MVSIQRGGEEMVAKKKNNLERAQKKRKKERKKQRALTRGEGTLHSHTLRLLGVTLAPSDSCIECPHAWLFLLKPVHFPSYNKQIIFFT
uniref:Uncharacterized protein n=1 Tax=Candidozyma auris TaxID=498019 RepID=A0A0L0P7W5_CANAR